MLYTAHICQNLAHLGIVRSNANILNEQLSTLICVYLYVHIPIISLKTSSTENSI